MLPLQHTLTPLNTERCPPPDRARHTPLLNSIDLGDILIFVAVFPTFMMSLSVSVWETPTDYGQGSPPL